MATRAANKRVCMTFAGISGTADRQKQLTREYKTISENPPPYIVAHPSETNILEFVVIPIMYHGKADTTS